MSEHDNRLMNDDDDDDDDDHDHDHDYGGNGDDDDDDDDEDSNRIGTDYQRVKIGMSTFRTCTLRLALVVWIIVVLL